MRNESRNLHFVNVKMYTTDMITEREYYEEVSTLQIYCNDGMVHMSEADKTFLFYVDIATLVSLLISV